MKNGKLQICHKKWLKWKGNYMYDSSSTARYDGKQSDTRVA